MADALDWLQQMLGTAPPPSSADQAPSDTGPAVLKYLQNALSGPGLQSNYDPNASFAQNVRNPAGIQQAMDVAMGFSGGGLGTYRAYKGMYPYDWRTQPVSTGSGERYWPLSHPQPELRGQKISPNESIPQPEPITEFNSTNGPFAGFFSDDPAVASRFARAFSPGAVYPTKVTLDNPAIIDAAGKPAGAFQFGDMAKEHGTLDEMKRFLRAIHDPASPHDGVILKNTKDEGTVYVPRTSSQIRSIFD